MLPPAPRRFRRPLPLKRLDPLNAEKNGGKNESFMPLPKLLQSSSELRL